jgi:hypothetical protein
MDMTITLGNAITLLGILLGASVGWGVAKQRLDDHERRIKAHTDQLSRAVGHGRALGKAGGVALGELDTGGGGAAARVRAAGRRV